MFIEASRILIQCVDNDEATAHLIARRSRSTQRVNEKFCTQPSTAIAKVEGQACEKECRYLVEVSPSDLGRKLSAFDDVRGEREVRRYDMIFVAPHVGPTLTLAVREASRLMQPKIKARDPRVERIEEVR